MKYKKTVAISKTKNPVLTSKCMKEKCSSSYVVREFQIKTMSYNCTTTRMAKIHNTDSIKFWLGTFIHYW